MRLRLLSATDLRTLCCTALLLGGACADDELPHFGTLQYQSDNLEVWASDGLVACEGTYDYTEQWLAAFRARATGYAANKPHTFYWLDEQDFEGDLCPPGTSACTYVRSRVIYSRINASTHELVHAELADLQPHAVLREGAAELFGATLADSRQADLSALWELDQIPADAYKTSGRFSRFLVDRYGHDAYFDIYETLDGDRGRESLSTTIRDTWGDELSELVAEFKKSHAACSIDRWRIYDYECGQLPLVDLAADGTWSERIDLSCGNDSAIGPRDGIIWTLRAFELDTAQAMILSIDSADDTARVKVFDCNASCGGSFVPQGARSASVAQGGSSPTATYGPGRYWIWIEHSKDTDAEVTVGLGPA